MVVISLSFLFVSRIPDLELKKLVILNVKMCVDTKTAQQKPSFFSQRTRKEAVSQDRKSLNSKHSTSAKHHRENICGPAHTYASKGWMECVAVHHCQAVSQGSGWFPHCGILFSNKRNKPLIRAIFQMNLHSVMLWGKASPKRLHPIGFYLYSILNMTKL